MARPNIDRTVQRWDVAPQHCEKTPYTVCSVVTAQGRVRAVPRVTYCSTPPGPPFPSPPPPHSPRRAALESPVRSPARSPARPLARPHVAPPRSGPLARLVSYHYAIRALVRTRAARDLCSRATSLRWAALSQRSDLPMLGRPSAGGPRPWRERPSVISLYNNEIPLCK